MKRTKIKKGPFFILIYSFKHSSMSFVIRRKLLKGNVTAATEEEAEFKPRYMIGVSFK